MPVSRYNRTTSPFPGENGVFDTQKITRSMTSRIQGSQDSSLKPGATLQGRYSILKVLGVGGMGSVYQARDMRFPNVVKYVAVKEIINIADPSMREMVVKIFEREANTLATLDHPAIPKIYDYFTQGDRSFLIQEFIDGRDLEAYLNDAPNLLEEDLVVGWAIQLCDVLSYLHKHQPEPIVFRDMKPSNVMIDHHNNIRLIDFGIARGIVAAGQKGTMIGTEGYSPPEQYRGDATPAGDIYALGATLHHLLTKQDPRIEPPFSFAERPIRKVNPSVSLELEAIINTALNYNLADRFPNAQAMKDALLMLRKRQTAAMARLPGSTGKLPGNFAPVETGTVPISPSDRNRVPTSAPLLTPSAAPATSGAVTPLWAFKCEDEVRGSPVVVNNVLYVGVYDNNLYAITAQEGQLLWKYATEGGLTGWPTVAQDQVLVCSEDRRLHAVSAKSGRVQWTYYADAAVRGSPRVAEGHVFFGADDHYLHAVNLNTGRRAWRMQASDMIRSRPLVEKDRIYFGCESGEFYALDMRGEQKWRFKAKRGITSSPSLHNNVVYFGSHDGMVYALEAASGWAVWRFRTNKPVLSSPAVEGNLMVVGSADGNVYAVDIRTGREAWHFLTEGQVNASPLIHKNAVYVGAVDGWFYALELSSGKLRWKFKSDGPITSSACALNDVVYVGSFDHHVYALTA